MKSWRSVVRADAVSTNFPSHSLAWTEAADLVLQVPEDAAAIMSRLDGAILGRKGPFCFILQRPGKLSRDFIVDGDALEATSSSCGK